jgi:hypothetical protein
MEPPLQRLELVAQVVVLVVLTKVDLVVLAVLVVVEALAVVLAPEPLGKVTTGAQDFFLGARAVMAEVEVEVPGQLDKMAALALVEMEEMALHLAFQDRQ